jgi:quinol monooxygenase YgiN
MEIERRDFLLSAACAAALGALVPSVLQGATGMYGLIVKVTIAPGKREDMIRILKESAADMPGCFSYVVSKDAVDENVVWVTEVWDSEASHDASANLPAVKKAIPQGKELVTGFEKIAVTTPVWGVGLKAASSR